MIDTELLYDARLAHKTGDYHLARDLYQEIAYCYNDFSELEKEAFTKEVANFAGDDPMYRDILLLVISQIQQAQEPILQSKLTNIIKQQYGERGAELLRYVLYYADYRDELKRVKKGRSYLLLLPTMNVEDLVVKTPKLPKKAKIKTIETDEEVERKEALARLKRLRARDAANLKEFKERQKVEMLIRKKESAKKEQYIACGIMLLFLIIFLAMIM
ncbi:hypothetical protein [Aggregatibacter actinomycetemcomitans]|uniref:hypothetical protein n=1 Tax=Aggregatibacter actinomycetemcomitans TaxID=714 RepID=UPI0002ABFA97|nr:hypothetical protein [Aggregatibacter actinomycetemcomitans]KOE63912.1 hypothetical protein SCC393_0311170 [Aggregatibacter actinomycetemcomitans serotype e str. SCC393]KOE67396.1 hypothetical protein A160_0201875 [Aggregatibacter actinomycetemcomitans serotype e str. A160]KYK78351.1 hypothetical protein SA2876_04250 [Aggregatibacter actinomycetemcomitans serotype e str. SA2876]